MELDENLNILLPSNNKSIYPIESKLNIHIPRYLYITWKSTDPETIPERWRKAYDELDQVMPHWTIIFTDDEQNRYVVEKYFPDFLSYYDNFEYHIQRVDAVRCLLLYIWGGLYKDMDMRIIKPLDPLFTNDHELYFVASPNVKNMLTNSFMASKPQSTFWLKYVEHMKQPYLNYAWGKHLKVMTSTGPMALDKLAGKSDIGYAKLPSVLVTPCSLCDIEECDTSESMIEPIWGSTWVGLDSKIYNHVFCHYRTTSYYGIIIFIIIILIVLIMLVLFFTIKSFRKK